MRIHKTIFLKITGLNLLDIINNLRNEDDDDLIIQCDVFDDEKQADDDLQASLNPNGLNINNHEHVFTALYQKVRNRPGVFSI